MIGKRIEFIITHHEVKTSEFGFKTMDTQFEDKTGLILDVVMYQNSTCYLVECEETCQVISPTQIKKVYVN